MPTSDLPLTAIEAMPSPKLDRPRLLLALTPLEEKLFFGAQVDAHQAELYRGTWTDDPASWRSLLEEVQPEILLIGWSARPITEDYLLSTSCRLKYICFLTGSIRRVVPRFFIERGGMVTNWGGMAASTVAEHTLLLILATLRRLPEWPQYFRPASCNPPVTLLELPTRTLFNRTVSIHGFGQVARELIRLLQPFNVRVRAYSAGVPASYIRSHGAEPVPTLEALFEEASLLVECEALTQATAGMVTEAIINRLPPGAIFINVGRGAVVDETALANRALQGLVYVGLDVFAQEPLPRESPLWRVPGAVLSPHIAGPTQDQLPLLGRRALENINRYISGETPETLITTEVYDRST